MLRRGNIILFFAALLVAAGLLLPIHDAAQSGAGESAKPPLAESDPQLDSAQAKVLGVDSDAPGRFLMVKLSDEAKPVAIMPVTIRCAAHTQVDAEVAFEAKPVRWPRTGQVRRYDPQGWSGVFAKYRAPDFVAGAELVYRRMDKGPRAAREEVVVPLSSVALLRWPQTWEDIWLRLVAAAPLAQRLEKAKAFDARFATQIENSDSQPDGFSQEEQAAYAAFYQRQFAVIRDGRVQDASIYNELADYHRKRGNIDAELSVYLDAIRNEVDEASRKTFHLTVGEIMVKRLRLYEDAIPHLDAAQDYADARLLRVEALHRLNRHEEAALRAAELVSAIDSGAAGLQFREAKERVRNRAAIWRARASIAMDHFKTAYDALSKLVQPAPTEQNESDVLLATLFLYRGDAQQATQKIEGNKTLNTLVVAARNPKSNLANLSYDTLGAQALAVWAGARVQQANDMLPDDAASALNYAEALDPMSVEPAIVRGQALAVQGKHFEALLAYDAGLKLNPGHPHLNYLTGSLELRAGNLDLAEARFARVLRASPDYYPALNGLGDCSVRRGEDAANQADAAEISDPKQAADLRADAMGHYVRASSCYSSSLDLMNEQCALRVRLAGLYLRLSDLTSDAGLSLSYLRNAADLAAQGMAAVEEYAKQDGRPPKLSPLEIASAPPLEAFTIFAFAAYELGRRENLPVQVDRARMALERLMVVGREPKAFPTSGAFSAYKDSGDFHWAKELLALLRSNERRLLKRDDFEGRDASRPQEVGRRWSLFNQRPDEGFLNGTKLDGGKLIVGVQRQGEAGLVSRLSLQEKFSTLALFRATVKRVGEGGISRGIHLTRADAGGDDKAAAPVWSVLVGFDADNNLFYDFREVKPEGERSLMGGAAVIPVGDYGGKKFAADDKVMLEVSRRVSEENGSIVEYWVEINGWRLRLDLNPVHEQDRDQFANAGFVADGKDAAAHVGFFVFGAKDASGAMEIEECEWVLDSNLANRSEK